MAIHKSPEGLENIRDEFFRIFLISGSFGVTHRLRVRPGSLYVSIH